MSSGNYGAICRGGKQRRLYSLQRALLGLPGDPGDYLRVVDLITKEKRSKGFVCPTA